MLAGNPAEFTRLPVEQGSHAWRTFAGVGTLALVRTIVAPKMVVFAVEKMLSAPDCGGAF